MQETETPGSTSSNGGDTSASEQAQAKAQDVAGQAQEKAQEAKGKAQDRLREQVEQRSTQAGQQVSSTASDLNTVAEQLRQQGQETPAKLAEQASERVQSVGHYLERSDADRILRDIEDYGRRNPLAVAAAGLALGFAASRFLKASSSQRYRQTGSSPSTNGHSDGGFSSSPRRLPEGATTADVPMPTPGGVA